MSVKDKLVSISNIPYNMYCVNKQNSNRELKDNKNTGQVLKSYKNIEVQFVDKKINTVHNFNNEIINSTSQQILSIN